MQYWALLLKLESSKISSVLEGLEGLESFSGSEELDEAGVTSLLQAPPEFEVLEFGSEAAKKCAQWLESEDESKGKGSRLVRFYFQSNSFVEDRLPAEIGERIKGLDYEEVSWLKLPDQDFNKAYRDSVEGVECGKALWIGPPWKEAPKGKHSFVVEPGMAFGTGDHPTTQMCLAFLEQLSENSSFKPMRAYDIGTGSGVLALGVRRFFPEAEIIATDLDPLCEQELKRSFELNSESLDRVVGRFSREADLAGVRAQPELWPKASLVVSNIYAEVLTNYIEEIAHVVDSGGLWVVSGLLESAALQDFDAQAAEFFEEIDRKTQALERLELEGENGMSAVRHVWHARLFKRRTL